MKKFIKQQWLYILLILGGATFSFCKAWNGELADMLFSFAFMLVALKCSFLQAKYDDLWEDHESLILDFIDELRDKIDFIGKAKMTLSSLAEEISEVKEQSKPKRGRPKKDVKPVKAKRGRPRSTK